MEIIFTNVDHIYQQKTPFEKKALIHVNSTIKSGSYVAVIGHTGSGKSTFMQHINGLLRPTAGTVTVGKYSISTKKTNLKSLRKQVGIVFQYPEHQLFEETVEKDICFGPMNFGLSEVEAKKRAKVMMEKVGLDESFLSKSPFELSGGQKRRVAIAGVLVMNPDVLILDEPTAGLDPRGRKSIMQLFKQLHDEMNMTTILVTHNMEDAAAYADEIIVMDKGNIRFHGNPNEIFENEDELKAMGLDIPESIQLKRRLEQQFNQVLISSGLNIDEVVNGIHDLFQRRKKR